MEAVQNLRVISPFFAIRQSSQGPPFITVPKGAVVETTAELEQPGLVPITVENQPLFAFMRDLREQAIPVNEPMLVRTASVGN